MLFNPHECITYFPLDIELDDLIEVVEGYRQRTYNEDMLAIKKQGGKSYE